MTGEAPHDGIQSPHHGGTAPSAEDGAWHRVHPISPWVRGWVVLIGLLFIVTQSIGEDLVGVLLGRGEFRAAEGLGITLAIYGGIFVVMVIFYYFAWRFTQYRLTEEMVQLDTGVLFKQHRQVRLDRVQAVDIRQPLLARIFNLGELQFEAADAGGSAMRLSFIKMDEATVLRAEIMGRAAGIQAGEDPAQAAARGAEAAQATAGALEGGAQAEDLAQDAVSTTRGIDDEATADGAASPGGAGMADDAGAPAAAGAGTDGTTAAAPGAGRAAMPEAPEQVMLKVPVGRVIGSVLLSSGTAWILGFAVLVQVAAAVADRFWPIEDGEESWFRISLFILIPVAFSLVGILWGGFNRGFNFTVATSADGLRLRYGLLETRQQTVAPGRVQAVGIHQSLFWRPFGWYRMAVNVAGYGGLEGAMEEKSTVLPVGTFDDVLRVLSVVAPDPGVQAETEPAAHLMRAGIAGTGEYYGFTHSPRRVRWLDPWVWRRRGFRSTETLLLLRSGRLDRRLTLMPHERIQSLNWRQGPLQRRLRVATLGFHSTPGPLSPALEHADVMVAERLFHEEAAIAAVSRRVRDRNQWMRPEELARFDQRTRQIAGEGTDAEVPDDRR